MENDVLDPTGPAYPEQTVESQGRVSDFDEFTARIQA